MLRLRRFRARKSLLLVCLVAVMAAMASAFGVADLAGKQRRTAFWLSHSLEVIAHASTLEADLAMISSEARGFLLVHDPDEESRFESVVQQTGADVSALRTLTADNPAQQAALDQLAPFVDARAAFLRGVIHQAQTGHDLAALSWIRDRSGRTTVARIAETMQAIKAEERRLLRVRAGDAQRATWQTLLALVACLTVALGGVLFAVAVLIGRRQQLAHFRAMRHVNASLDERVRQRTAELIASEARFRLLAENANDVVTWVGADGARLYVSPAATGVLGVSPEKLRAVGDILPLIHPDHRESVSQLQRDLLDGSIEHGRLTFCMEGGQDNRTWVETSARLIRDPARGTPDGYIAVLRDVTSAKSAEQALKASEAKLQSYFANLADGIVVFRMGTDGEALYSDLNRSAERLFGMSAPEIRGKSPSDIWPEDHARQIEAHLRLCIQSGNSVSATEMIAGADSRKRELLLTLTPIKDDSGQVREVIKTLRDVTEHRQLEEALHHTQKMEVIGRISAGVAHDFNNILQALSGSLELVLDDLRPGSRAYDFADLALRSVHRAADLTHYLLSYARKQVLLPCSIDLAVFLPELRNLLARTLGTQILIELEVERDLPMIAVDPSQLQTALLNLAINASHAMPNGGTLRLIARRSSRRGRITVIVEDTGTGMDAETLARACEPFFTTKGTEGTGLGLSMVQGFAEQSGGAMHITSAPRLGTRVDVELPAGAPRSGLSAREGSNGQTTLSGRVLLVDDNPDLLTATAELLEQVGLDVVGVGGPNEALAHLAYDTGFDALVTDYAMADRNGIELLLAGRLLKPELSGLIITGLAELAPAEDLPGDVLVVQKPFRQDELIAALVRVANQGGGPISVSDDQDRAVPKDRPLPVTAAA